MALSLNDVKKNTDKKKEELKKQDDRVLRPWESFESRGLQTRTVTAREAVKKAREIVEKNNQFVDDLRSGLVEDDIIQEIEKKVSDRNSVFDETEIDPVIATHQIKTNNKVISFIKGVFGA